MEGRLTPVIPGSSLRGMIRQLVEIVGYGRMRWVAAEPKVSFRAVAAPKTDPLKKSYEAALGKNGAKVKAGYLVKTDNGWEVAPTWTLSQMGFVKSQRDKSDTWLKISDERLQEMDIPGYIPLHDPNYRPQLHPISFDAEVRQTEPDEYGKCTRYTYVTQIGPRGTFKHRGVLVCSGNMSETQQNSDDNEKKGPVKTDRAWQVIVLPFNLRAPRLPILPQAVKNYLDTITPFQKDDLRHDWSKTDGCLAHGKPVFYVKNEEGKVIYFGHSPNFRIPAQLSGSNRAATPQDFVPEAVLQSNKPDLADAIFGWVEEQTQDGRIVGPAGQRAGRVFFGDACYTGHKHGVWYSPQPITPHVLASPKPTTFQHYLVQDRNVGHDPDKKETLAHYGSPTNETQIRGYKMYWRRGDNPPIKANKEEKEHESQLTRMTPVQKGVAFQSRIWFDNLTEVELGALLWALCLPGDGQKTYCHQIGMGKPLGMGAVKITPTLCLTQRPQRYRRLFTESQQWDEQAEETSPDSFIRAFTRFILKEIGRDPEKDELAREERIRMLLTMLEWREGTQNWLERTRYMEIRHGENEENEYKDRPVLPDPLKVIHQGR